MNLLVAATTGAGVGLVFFGGLWLTVRQVTRHPRGKLLLPLSSLARLAVVALVFLWLSREGPGVVLAGLVGLLLARWVLIHHFAEPAMKGGTF